MSSNSADLDLRSIHPGGPPRQPNMTGERDELITNPEGVPTFYQDRVVDKDPYAEPTTASDTLTGATSADVHDGYGHPGQGQTSAELHHDGQKGRKKQEVGVDQWGTQRPENMKAHVDERKRHFQS